MLPRPTGQEQEHGNARLVYRSMSYGANCRARVCWGRSWRTTQSLRDGREIQTVASLLGAAVLWAENRARRVYQMVPSGSPGRIRGSEAVK